MPDLSSSTKEPEISPLDEQKAKEYLKKLADWQLSADGKKIFRRFDFKNFREAVDFVVGAADFAEKIDHYPETIIIRFQKVTVELTSRRAKGLSEKDFLLAEELDSIAGWKKKLEQWLASPKVIVPLLIILLLVILWQRLG